MNKQGLLFALSAYTAWGVFPIYWKLLQQVPALQLISHRIIWSFALLMIILALKGGIKTIIGQMTNLKVLRVYALASILIGINWLFYVWAVNAGFIIETSLGYFINPLISVLLGTIFFKERLRPMQWIAVLMATIGVAYLTIAYGRLPWIALILAFSFGFYGLVKKLAPLSSVSGLTMETGLLFLPALGYLLFSEWHGGGAFTHSGLQADLLMIGTGLITTFPLLMFASATQRIPLSMVGLMQYIAPTIQFLIGIFIFHEPFSNQQLIGFGLVWIGLIIFISESILRARQPIAPKTPIQL